MPSQIHPRSATTGLGRYRLSVLKADGSPGEIQNPPPFSMDNPALADMTLAPDGPHEVKHPGAGEVEPGVYEVQFRHNGSQGQFVASVGEVDGDLGEGVKQIGPFSDTVEMLGPLGAESASFGALPEEAA